MHKTMTTKRTQHVSFEFQVCYAVLLNQRVYICTCLMCLYTVFSFTYIFCTWLVKTYITIVYIVALDSDEARELHALQAI